jgi:hypothetical protein
MDGRIVVREVGRPHADQQVGHLLRRVGQEIGMISMERTAQTVAATRRSHSV